MPWGSVAPAAASRTPPPAFAAGEPSAYPASSWKFFDDAVRLARQRGIGIDLTIGAPPPLWAAGPGPPAGGPYSQWRPSPAAFGQFIRAAATRYSGTYTPTGADSPLPRVGFWSIWNEPNYGPSLAPQAVDHSTIEVSPALYRRLVDAAWAALKSTGHGHDTILIGELAPRGITIGDSPGNFSGMVPLRFLRALYCVDPSGSPYRGAAATARSCPSTAAGSDRFRHQHPALFEASGLAIHPYPQGLAPDVPTPDEPDYADLPQVPQVERLLESLQARYGSSTRFAIYLTEFGYKTDPPDIRGGAVSPRQAAAYLNQAEYIVWKDPRIRSWDQYLLWDPPPGSGSDFDTGLEFSPGVRKPSFAAFRMPIYLPRSTGPRGSPFEVWGCVRPARYLPADGPMRRARIEFRAGGANRYTTVSVVPLNDPGGYFDTTIQLRSSGTVRLAWSYPGGRTIFSRTVAVSLQ
jgi:hypothetical protein